MAANLEEIIKIYTRGTFIGFDYEAIDLVECITLKKIDKEKTKFLFKV